MPNTIISLDQPQDFPGHELGRQVLAARMEYEYYSPHPIVVLVRRNPNTGQYDILDLIAVGPFENEKDGWWWQFDSHSDGIDGVAATSEEAASDAFDAMAEKYPDADY